MKNDFLSQLNELVGQATKYIAQELGKMGGEMPIVRNEEELDEIYAAPCFYVYGKYDTVDRYAIAKLVRDGEQIMVHGLAASEGAQGEEVTPLDEMEAYGIIALADHIENCNNYILETIALQQIADEDEDEETAFERWVNGQDLPQD